jgi:hypothetical protein
MRVIAKTIVFLAVLLILAGGSVSCANKEPKEVPFGNPIEISFEKYSLEGTASQWKNLSYDKSVIPINSNEELKNYVAGNDFPAIDFLEHTLLLMSWQDYVWQLKNTSLLWQTSHHKYTLELVAEAYTSKDVETWEYAILVPKLSEKAEITAEIQFNIVGAIDFSNIEKLWEQPLPILQRVVFGRWQWIATIYHGVALHEINMFVEITKDTLFLIEDGVQSVVPYGWTNHRMGSIDTDAYFMYSSSERPIWCFISIQNDTLRTHLPFSTFFDLARVK